MLALYNTLTRKKEIFRPLQPGRVGMYVCGMTVYDFCHLGHARVMVVFDMVRRWLRASGYTVRYVRNITDIDDKIIRRAVDKGETISQLTQRYIEALHEDCAALGVEAPDDEPRATAYIPQMLGLIERLQAHGLAYQAADGDVNYAVRKFPAYGKLSGKSLDDLRAGERVEVAQNKQDPLDFVLWKHAKVDEPDEVKWPSPWGVGRPGWHIECSAMSCSLLGARFDIHGGGADLQFPHHENEIAQSEGADPQAGQFVNYWMHNGFVQMNDEKMSKSLGNFLTIRELLKQHDPEVLRFFILRAHYRSPLSYSPAHLDDARQSLARLYGALREISPTPVSLDWQSPALSEYAQRFKTALDDDFNTPVAFAALFDLASAVHKTRSPDLAGELRQLAGILGLLQRDPQVFFQGGNLASDDNAVIQGMVNARNVAKQAKDFTEADRLRTLLSSQGIVLEDTPQGTLWRRA